MWLIDTRLPYCKNIVDQRKALAEAGADFQKKRANAGTIHFDQAKADHQNTAAIHHRTIRHQIEDDEGMQLSGKARLAEATEREKMLLKRILPIFKIETAPKPVSAGKGYRGAFYPAPGTGLSVRCRSSRPR